MKILVIILTLFLANFLSYPVFQATSKTDELRKDKNLASSGQFFLSCPSFYSAFPFWLYPLAYF